MKPYSSQEKQSAIKNNEDQKISGNLVFEKETGQLKLIRENNFDFGFLSKLKEYKVTTKTKRGTKLSKNLQTFLADETNSSILKDITVEIISNIKKCASLWREFSPQKSLFETWEFRYAFYKAYKHKPHFILVKNKSENLGLLPLWYDKDKKRYSWFGSDWQEENAFFVKNPNLIPFLLYLCPSPVLLESLNLKNFPEFKNYPLFKQDDPKFVLKLRNIKSAEDFLIKKLKKNRRHNFRKDKRRIERQNPKIIINNFSNLKEMNRITKKRFKGKNQKADWEEDSRIARSFENIVKMKKGPYQLRMITVKIKNKVASVDLIALYNQCYYALKCGYDVRNFSGIGNFVNLFEIDDAINLGMKKIDFLQVNYGWKDKWFKAIPLLKYEK